MRDCAAVLVLLSLSVIFGSLLAVTGDLAQAVSPRYSFAVTADASLMHNEPIHIADLRATLGGARHAIASGDWALALRLVRDGRNQWNVFRILAPKVYPQYNQGVSAISAQTLFMRDELLWDYVVQHAELKAYTKTLRALGRLQSRLGNYRFRFLRTS